MIVHNFHVMKLDSCVVLFQVICYFIVVVSQCKVSANTCTSDLVELGFIISSNLSGYQLNMAFVPS